MRLFKTTVSTLALTSACGMFLLIGPALGVAIGKTSGLEAPGCDPVSGDGATLRNDDGVFVGSGTLFIRGMEFEVEIRTTILSDPIPGDDGTLHVTTSHEFTFDDDDESTITTTDKAILEPTDEEGVFKLNSNMKITSGTGVYEGVSGRLHAHGEVDFILGTASFTNNGVICVGGE